MKYLSGIIVFIAFGFVLANDFDVSASYQSINLHTGLNKPSSSRLISNLYRDNGGQGSGWGAEGSQEHNQGYTGHKYADSYPEYKFEYTVHDDYTGDYKNHWENRDGHQVIGEYSLKEADGTTRVVSYDADEHTGFNAVVKNYEPLVSQEHENVFNAAQNWATKLN